MLRLIIGNWDVKNPTYQSTEFSTTEIVATWPTNTDRVPKQGRACQSLVWYNVHWASTEDYITSSDEYHIRFNCEK